MDVYSNASLRCSSTLLPTALALSSMTLSMEVGEDKIRVNAIQPGIVEGARIDKVIEDKASAVGNSVEEQRKLALEYTSMKQMVSPYDIANMALYLASPAGATVTGQAISVCAGVEMLS